MGKQKDNFVGVAGGMPGTEGGFTVAAFNAADVPPGTKLYTKPQTNSNVTDFDTWYEGRYGKVDRSDVWANAQRADALEVWNASRSEQLKPRCNTGENIPWKSPSDIPHVCGGDIQFFVVRVRNNVTIHTSGVSEHTCILAYANNAKDYGEFHQAGWYETMIPQAGWREGSYGLRPFGRFQQELLGWMELTEFHG